MKQRCCILLLTPCCVQVILTPAPLKGTGMVNKAKELAKEHGYFETRQFEHEVRQQTKSLPSHNS